MIVVGFEESMRGGGGLLGESVLVWDERGKGTMVRIGKEWGTKTRGLWMKVDGKDK